MTSISELEQDIAESRARLDKTIDQLQDRMTASGVLDEVLGTARRSGYGTSLDRAADTLRAHPVPVLLVVAGLGWLAYSMTEAGRRRDLRARARRDLDERLGPRPAVRPVDRDEPEAERRERAEREGAAAARMAESTRTTSSSAASSSAASSSASRPTTVGASDLRTGETRSSGNGRAETATRPYGSERPYGGERNEPAKAGGIGSVASATSSYAPTSRAGEPPDRGGVAAGARAIVHAGFGGVRAGARVGERVMGGDGGLRASDVPPGAVRRPSDPTHAAPEGEALHRSPAPSPARASPAAPGDTAPGASGTRR